MKDSDVKNALIARLQREMEKAEHTSQPDPHSDWRLSGYRTAILDVFWDLYGETVDLDAH